MAFAWTGGWLTPQRLTPEKFLEALSPPGGPALGYRRNHAKGICFTGEFDSNGAGTALSKAHVADAKARVRGLGIRITTPDGREWRSAMIDLPFFPVSTPQAFYQLLRLSTDKDPNAVGAFAAAPHQISLALCATKSIHAACNALTTSAGLFLRAFSSARAGPVGVLNPCSQFRSVPTLTSMRRTNCA